MDWRCWFLGFVLLLLVLVWWWWWVFLECWLKWLCIFFRWREEVEISLGLVCVYGVLWWGSLCLWGWMRSCWWMCLLWLWWCLSLCRLRIEGYRRFSLCWCCCWWWCRYCKVYLMSRCINLLGLIVGRWYWWFWFVGVRWSFWICLGLMGLGKRRLLWCCVVRRVGCICWLWWDCFVVWVVWGEWVWWRICWWWRR